jgi:hypothetical protein
MDGLRGGTWLHYLWPTVLEAWERPAKAKEPEPITRIRLSCQRLCVVRSISAEYEGVRRVMCLRR